MVARESNNARFKGLEGWTTPLSSPFCIVRDRKIMNIPDRTKGHINQRQIAALTLPWTQERFSRGPVGANWQGEGLSGLDGLGDIWSDIGSTAESDLGTAVNNAIQYGMTQLTSKTSQSGTDPVPVQNSVTNDILAPVSNALQMPVVTQHADLLNALFTFLQNGKQVWYNWINSHPSSRAYAAKATLDPYFTGLQNSIQSKLSTLGANVPVIPGTSIPIPSGYVTSGISAGMVAVAAIGLYFLSRRR
jgi:hypothetical protein